VNAFLKLLILIAAGYAAQLVVECTSVVCMDAGTEGPMSDVEMARLVHATPGTLALYDCVSGGEAEISTLAQQANTRLRTQSLPARLPTQTQVETPENKPAEHVVREWLKKPRWEVK
jgi:hypothetical protein